MRADTFAAALLLAGAVAGAAGWSSVRPGRTFAFPRDHGAHPAARTEWWYLTGTLRRDDGREYGAQITFFRRGIDPAPPAPGDSDLRARSVLAAHLAIADVGAGTLRSAQRLRRAAAGLADAREGDLDVRVERWRLWRTPDGRLHALASDPASGVGLDLTFTPGTPPVLEGDGGVSRKGPEPGNASAYVSYPRLATAGTLTVGGVAFEVRGGSWFDHEWGTTELGPGVVGWDWFGLRLAGGRDLMLYRLRLAGGSESPFSAGTVIAADGSSRPLAPADFSIDVLARWKSPSTGAVYPSRWRLRVPSAGVDVEVRPLLAAAEIDARESTGTIYWEGPVAVTGSEAGEGYVELTGYAGSMSGVL